MTTLQIVQGIAAIAVLAWLLHRVLRRPRDVRLRAISVLIAALAGAYPFGVAATEGTDLLGLDPMTSRLIQHTLLLIGSYSLICFLLYSAHEKPHARTRAYQHALPLVSALTIMVTATVIMPDSLRTVAAILPAGNHPEPTGELSIGLFYTTANTYMLFAFGSALVVCHRYARRAEPRLRRALHIASVGLAMIVLATASFVAANVARWAGGVMPRPILLAGITLLLPGVLLFLIGVLYPAAATRLATLRVWWQHRNAYRDLEPLWTALHREFPEDELPRVPTKSWKDALSLRGVHRRYYRRSIECRDGLVRISPYIAQLRQNGHQNAPLAALLREALRSHAGGDTAPDHATPVAIPTAPGLDADVDELIALSRELRETDNQGGS